MPKLTALDIARRIKLERKVNNSTLLIYGPPKTGKTRLAGTIAQVPNIGRIVWADLEQGVVTLPFALAADGTPLLTDEELGRIEVLSIGDTLLPSKGAREKAGMTSVMAVPRAAEVMLKMCTSTIPLHFDNEQNKLVPKATENTISFHLRGMQPNDVLVIDSGSQLANSLFALQELANPEYKDPRKYWASFYQDANTLMSAIQASHAIVIMICHSQETEPDAELAKRSETLPTFGSVNYSRNVGKYFSTVVHLYLDKRVFKSLSNPITKANVQGGSRYNVDTSRIENPTMADILAITLRTES